MVYRDLRCSECYPSQGKRRTAKFGQLVRTRSISHRTMSAQESLQDSRLDHARCLRDMNRLEQRRTVVVWR